MGHLPRDIAIVGIIAAVAISAVSLIALEAFNANESKIEVNNFGTTDEVVGNLITAIHQSVRTIANPISSSHAEEQEDYLSALEQAKEIYNNAIIRARAVYEQVIADENVDMTTKDNASTSYVQAIENANTNYENTIDELTEQYDESKTVITMLDKEGYKTAIEQANLKYRNALALEKQIFEKLISEAQGDKDEEDRIEQEYDENIAEIKQTYNTAINQAMEKFKQGQQNDEEDDS